MAPWCLLAYEGHFMMTLHTFLTFCAFKIKIPAELQPSWSNPKQRGRDSKITANVGTVKYRRRGLVRARSYNRPVWVAVIAGFTLTCLSKPENEDLLAFISNGGTQFDTCITICHLDNFRFDRLRLNGCCERNLWIPSWAKVKRENFTIFLIPGSTKCIRHLDTLNPHSFIFY